MLFVCSLASPSPPLRVHVNKGAFGVISADNWNLLPCFILFAVHGSNDGALIVIVTVDGICSTAFIIYKCDTCFSLPNLLHITFVHIMYSCLTMPVVRPEQITRCVEKPCFDSWQIVLIYPCRSVER